ncbi:MAG: 5'-deoxynucleotidase [Clostridiales bacterium]|nr:5'-deoxynucleotidase [Clostridiales bacterium]
MYPFFAYLDRMKLIRRWGLMRNTEPENDMEHSLQTAFIAHGLANISLSRFGREIRPEHVAVMAMYHDVSEVMTGDLPTPIKYKNPAIKDAYQEVEKSAREQLLHMLPGDLRFGYAEYIQPDETSLEWKLVKAADRISAYLKCLTEEKLGNREFVQAKESILRSLEENPLPEVKVFMDEFVEAFGLSLDDLSRVEMD